MTLSLQDLAIIIGILQVLCTIVALYVGSQMKLLKAEIKLLKAELVSNDDCERKTSAYETRFGKLNERLTRAETVLQMEDKLK